METTDDPLGSELSELSRQYRPDDRRHSSYRRHFPFSHGLRRRRSQASPDSWRENAARFQWRRDRSRELSPGQGPVHLWSGSALENDREVLQKEVSLSAHHPRRSTNQFKQ